MENRDDDHHLIIRNRDTRARRAWVECALDSVRRRLDEDGDPLPTIEERPRERPPLYIVHSSRKR